MTGLDIRRMGVASPRRLHSARSRRRAVLGILLTLIPLIFLVGCRGDSAERDAPVPTPPVEGTRPIQETTEYGSDGEPLLFFHLSCDGDLLTLVTTHEALYAELPCDRSLPRDIVERFLGQQIVVKAVVASPSKLFIHSLTAGSVEFTVGGLWIVEH